MVIENYPEGFIVPAKSSSSYVEEVKSDAVINSESLGRNNEISKTESRIENLMTKIDRAQDKIDRLREKISSGKSDEQDRLQYTRYVETREKLKDDLRDLKNELQTLREGYGKAEVLEKKPEVVREEVKQDIQKANYEPQVLKQFSTQRVAEEVGITKYDTGLFVAVDKFPYKDIAPTVYQRNIRTSEFIPTEYELSKEKRTEVMLESKDYGVTTQSVSGEKKPYVSEVRSTSESFGDTPGYTVQKVSEGIVGKDSSIPYTLATATYYAEQYYESDLGAPIRFSVGVASGLVEVGKGAIQSGGRVLGAATYATAPGSFAGGPEIDYEGNVNIPSVNIPKASTMDIVSVGILAVSAVPGVIGKVALTAASTVGVVQESKDLGKVSSVEEAGSSFGKISLFALGYVPLFRELALRTAPYRAPETVFSEQSLTTGKLDKAFSTEKVLQEFNIVRYEPEVPLIYRTQRDLLKTDFPISKGSIDVDRSVVVYQKPFIETIRQPIEVATAGERSLVTKGVLRELGESNPPESTKGKLGLEDVGIYTTAKGQVMGKFLGIGEPYEYKITFNPLKSLTNIPTVTELEVRSVDLLPRDVVAKPGFSTVTKFYEEIGGKTGRAYITKRSELGRGELPRQFFVAEKDFTVPWAKMIIRVDGREVVVRRGTLVKKGTEVLEPGTTEPEAVVPYTAQFSISNKLLDVVRGGQQRTQYEGVTVAIKKGKLLSEEPIAPTVSEEIISSDLALVEYVDKPIDRSVKISSVSDISSGQSNVVYVSPIEVSAAYSFSDYVNESSVSARSSSDVSIVVGSSSSYVPSPSSPSPSIPSQPITYVSIPSEPTPSTPSVTIPFIPSIPTIYTPSEPKPIIPIKPIIPMVPEQNFFIFAELDKTSEGTFFLEVKRRGKFKRVDVGELSKLETALPFRLKESLAASARIVDELGRPINVRTPIGLSRSKRDKDVIVQPRSQRLSTQFERLEIQKSKRLNRGI